MTIMANKQPDYWPTRAWRTADPEDHGMRSAVLADITAYGQDSDPPMSGIVVIRHGYVVFERYFRGFHERSAHTVNSVTKSVLSTLAGIALSRGYLVGLDQPASEFFPEVDRLDVDQQARRITLRHLLSMTSGWAPDPIDLNEFTTNEALVETALQRTIAHEPGTAFWYDNLGAHLLSVLLARATSMNTAEFAHRALLGPLGIWTDQTPRFIWRSGVDEPHTFHRFALWNEQTGLPWKVDPSGHSGGYAGLHLTVRDMAKFGYLCLNDGWWDGQQVIPSEYLAESTRPQNGGGPPGGAAYGYLWWTPAEDPHGTFFGYGAGGQYVYVVPRLDLVVAIASTGVGTSDPTGSHPTREVLGRLVIPATT